ncbi:SARP family transcriptional regulator [Rhizocola hellebori]|uniref:SARP family transcriptional regulator n=1 Tax=Rhizocola hellebori TaxID=1392758 RepID=A0A8J3VL74_9ACTN|nr:BTAD domain-containing putative transcriptional regulator [Rhizocola hellebori]GIH10332.1 SARP family transcriptional regulator [Rhizocola hellebori]
MEQVERIWFELLGGVRAWRGDEELDLGGSKPRAVLLALLLRAKKVVSQAEIVEAVWGDAATGGAHSLVQTYVMHLRRVLEPGRARRGAGKVLVSSVYGYTLRIEPDQLDLSVFTQRIGVAQKFRAAGDLPAAVDAFDAALSLWHGPILADLSGPLAEVERVRLQELRLAALEERAEVVLGLGHHAAVIAELKALSAQNPYRESLCVLLMIALYRNGRRADALACFADMRRRLIDELAIEPGPNLQRVHHDILNDRDASVSGAAKRLVPRQLPRDVHAFAGRHGELRELDCVITEVGQSPVTAVISALSGTAGIGKTALAVHWAHCIAERFPDGQLYINLRGFDPALQAMNPEDVLRQFLHALGVPAGRIPVHPEAQAALYRSEMADRQMLLVLDNARDSAQVRPLLPGARTCVVVVTSRNHLTGLIAADGARSFPLDLLTVEDARDLLAYRLGRERINAEAQAVEQIITCCARLPLALAIAAARAGTEPHRSLGSLATELQNAGARLDLLATDDPHINVRAVFSWSYRALPPEAARLFRLLSLHPGPEISLPCAASLAARPAVEVSAQMQQLIQANLVAEPTSGRYSFHDLLRAYAGEQTQCVDDELERASATNRMLDHYLHTAFDAAMLLYPARDPICLTTVHPAAVPEVLPGYDDAMAWFSREHKVLMTVLNHAASHDRDTVTAQLAWTLATYLEQRGDRHDYAISQELAAKAADRLGDPALQILTHRLYANALAQLGHFELAHDQLIQCLALSTRSADDVATAKTHDSLAFLNERQGRYGDALAHAEQALSLFNKLGRKEGLAIAYNTVGWLHAMLGEYASALTFCRQSLDLHEELGNRLGQAETWDSIGYAHHQLGNTTQAIECYDRGLHIFRDLGDNYQEANTLSHQGDTHEAAGDLKAARKAWQSALSILEQLDHPDAAELRAKLSASA